MSMRVIFTLAKDKCINFISAFFYSFIHYTGQTVYVDFQTLIIKVFVVRPCKLS